jgi:hypothetical protein
MRWRRASLATLAIALGVSGFRSLCQGVPALREQRHFSAEDEGVKNPSTIPDEVMAILRNDRLVQNVAKDQEIPLDKVPATWFSASRIKLGGAGPTDLIVAAEGPLAGGNVDVFWVFIQQNGSFKQALMLPAHDLIVKNTVSHGYRDIEALAATAVTVSTGRFRFNGKVYKRYTSKTDDIK